MMKSVQDITRSFCALPAKSGAAEQQWWRQHARATFRLHFSDSPAQLSPVAIRSSVTRHLAVGKVVPWSECVSCQHDCKVLPRDCGSGGDDIHLCVSRSPDLEWRYGCSHLTMGGTITTDAARNSLLFLLLLLLFGMLIHVTNMAAAAPTTTSTPSPEVSICMREGCNCTKAAPHWLIVTCSFDSKQASVVAANSSDGYSSSTHMLGIIWLSKQLRTRL